MKVSDFLKSTVERQLKYESLDKPLLEEFITEYRVAVGLDRKLGKYRSIRKLHDKFDFLKKDRADLEDEVESREGEIHTYIEEIGHLKHEIKGLESKLEYIKKVLRNLIE
jgi:predicted  nucleic acid-binding Zn-ribbon protein